MRHKVADYKQYEKDPVSKGIVNVDTGALNAYKIQRKKLGGIFDVQSEVEEVKKDVAEIKALLLQLINNK